MHLPRARAGGGGVRMGWGREVGHREWAHRMGMDRGRQTVWNGVCLGCRLRPGETHCGKDVLFIQTPTARMHDIVLRFVNGKKGLLTMAEVFDVGRQQGIHFVWIRPEQVQGSRFVARGDQNDGDEPRAEAIKQHNCVIQRVCDV